MMKKLIFSLVAILFAVGVMAQPPQKGERGERPSPQEMLQRRCQHLIQKMGLEQEAAAKFEPIYRRYQQEMMQIHRQYGRKHFHPRGQETTPPTDEQIEERMLNRFALSRAILEVRERYYKEFRTVLSPRQVQHIYDQEREGGERMQHRHRPK